MKQTVPPDIAYQIIEWWEAKHRIRREIAELNAKRRAMGSFKTVSHKYGVTPREIEGLVKSARARWRVQRLVQARNKP